LHIVFGYLPQISKVTSKILSIFDFLKTSFKRQKAGFYFLEQFKSNEKALKNQLFSSSVTTIVTTELNLKSCFKWLITH
jgi:hypothetical protein